jgi:hypothetical protein
MYFLLSGEGPADMGVGIGAAAICEGKDYECGPMAVFVDQIVESRHKYSPFEAQCCGFVSEHTITTRTSELKKRKEIRAPGKKKARETHFHFTNARVLARIAGEKQKQLQDDVVAVLFHDSDDVASAGRSEWNEKRDSMLHGFQEEEFARGVPMVPKPTSEAWVIAGMTGNSNHRGKPLEDWSGKTNTANSLKVELEKLLGEKPSAEKLCEMVRERSIDYEKIKLPSFNAFRERLVAVL